MCSDERYCAAHATHLAITRAHNRHFHKFREAECVFEPRSQRASWWDASSFERAHFQRRDLYGAYNPWIRATRYVKRVLTRCCSTLKYVAACCSVYSLSFLRNVIIDMYTDSLNSMHRAESWFFATTKASSKCLRRKTRQNCVSSADSNGSRAPDLFGTRNLARASREGG